MNLSFNSSRKTSSSLPRLSLEKVADGSGQRLEALVSPGGSLVTRDDPYSVVTPSRRIESLHANPWNFGSDQDARLTHHQVGVGIVFSMDKNSQDIMVREIEPDSAADRDRMVKVGDVLLKVDGRSVRHHTLGVVRSWIIGHRATKVRLTFRRVFLSMDPTRSPETTVFEVELTRGSALELITAKIESQHKEMEELSLAMLTAEKELDSVRTAGVRDADSAAKAMEDEAKLEPTIQKVMQEKSYAVEQQERVIQMETELRNIEYLARASEMREKSALGALGEEQQNNARLEAKLRELEDTMKEKKVVLAAEREKRQQIEGAIRDVTQNIHSREQELHRYEDLIRELQTQVQLMVLREEYKAREMNLRSKRRDLDTSSTNTSSVSSQHNIRTTTTTTTTTATATATASTLENNRNWSVNL